VEIKLLSLQTRGFKRLNFDEKLVFPDGALLIYGCNESGKSTIMEAIHYALYGMFLRPTKRASIDDILNYGLDVGFIKLTFSIGEDKYEVRRTIKRKGEVIHELRIDKQDGTKEAIASARNVNKAIIDALHGIDSDALLNSCLVEQKELGKLESSQRQDRINTISTLLNLEAFTSAEQELKRYDKEINEELNGSLTEKGIKTAVDEWKAMKENYEEALNNKVRAESRLGELEEELPAIEKEVRELDSRLRAVSKINKILGDIQGLETKLSHAVKDLKEAENLKEELEDLNKKIMVQEKVLKAKERLESIEECVDNIEGDRNLKNREEEAIKELRSKLTNLEGIEEKVDKGEKRLIELRKSKEQVIRNRMLGYVIIVGGVIGLALGIFAYILIFLGAIVALLAGGYLITKSNLGKINSVLVKKEAEVDQYRADRLRKSEYEQNLRKGSKSFAIIRERIKENTQNLLALVENLPNTPSAYKNDFLKIYPQNLVMAKRNLTQIITRDKEEYTRMITRKRNIEPIVGDLENRKKNVDKLRKEINNLKSQKTNIEKDFQIKAEDEEILRRYYGEKSTKKGELEKEKEERSRTQKECEGIIEMNKGAPERYEYFLHKKNELIFLLEAINRSKKLLNLARDTVFGSVKKNIEKNMMKFLPLLTANRYKVARVDEKNYKIEVYDTEARRWRIKGIFSGATQDQVSLALRLAFALSTLPMSRGVVPGFIFLDEPLSGFDEERKRGLLELLTKGDIAKQFAQIIVISHSEQLKEEFSHMVHLDRGKIIG
jgi:DNA repair exonuclease SbcCD ATPase subunit